MRASAQEGGEVTAVLLYLFAAVCVAVVTVRIYHAHATAIRVTPQPIRFVLANLGRGMTAWAEREHIYGESLIEEVRIAFDHAKPRPEDSRVVEFRRNLAKPHDFPFLRRQP